MYNGATRTQHVMMDVPVSQSEPAHHRYIFQAEAGLDSESGTGLSIIISEQDENNARVSVDNVFFKPRNDLVSIFYRKMPPGIRLRKSFI